AVQFVDFLFRGQKGQQVVRTARLQLADGDGGRFHGGKGPGGGAVLVRIVAVPAGYVPVLEGYGILPAFDLDYGHARRGLGGWRPGGEYARCGRDDWRNGGGA